MERYTAFDFTLPGCEERRVYVEQDYVDEHGLECGHVIHLVRTENTFGVAVGWSEQDGRGIACRVMSFVDQRAQFEPDPTMRDVRIFLLAPLVNSASRH